MYTTWYMVNPQGWQDGWQKSVKSTQKKSMVHEHCLQFYAKDAYNFPPKAGFDSMCTSMKIFCKAWQEMEETRRVQVYCKILAPHNIVFTQHRRAWNSLKYVVLCCLSILVLLCRAVYKCFVTTDVKTKKKKKKQKQKKTKNCRVIENSGIL